MISFGTVIYRAELPLLELQAKSFSRWVSDYLVTEIIIALNDINTAKLREEVEAIRHLYGVHSSKVRILSAKSLLLDGLNVPIYQRMLLFIPELSGRKRRTGGWRGHPGWLMQQALKLSFGRVVVSPHTVLLDAKNIWLASPDFSDFFTKDNKAKCDYIRGFSGKNQRAWFPPSLEAVGFSLDLETVGRTTHFLTPFPIQSSILHDAGIAVAEKRGSIVSAFLFNKPHPTEFFILNAYVLKNYGSLDAVFSEGLKICTPLSAAMNSDAIDNALAEAENGTYKSIALHSKAWRRFSQKQSEKIKSILKDIEEPLQR